MARRNKNENTEPEVEVTEGDVTNEASPAEATDAPAEVTETAPTEPDPSEELLNVFKATLAEVVGEPVTDEAGTTSFTKGQRGDNGELNDEDMGRIVAAYTALKPHRKAANTALQHTLDQLGVIVNLGIGAEGAEQAARALMNVRITLENTKAPRKETPSAPVDPTDEFVQRYATVLIGQQVLFNSPPEGVAEDWAERASNLHDKLQDQLTTYLTWLATDADERGDEPEVDDVIKAGVRLAEGKASKGKRKGASTGARTPFTGTRGNILDHIQTAFREDKDKNPIPVGTTLTVAQIAAVESKTYGAGKASAGAISARLFGGNWDVKATGIEPNPESSPKSATKIAEPVVESA